MQPGGSIHALLLLAALPLAATQWQICGNSVDQSANGKTYLTQLAAALPRKASAAAALFATATVPEAAASVSLFTPGAGNTFPDAVFTLTLCRGDVNASTCDACIHTAFQDAQQLCPNDTDVSIAYDDCYLRYTNSNFLASTNNSGVLDLYNTAKFSGDVGHYSRVVAGLLKATAAYAAGNTTRLFATGEVVGLDDKRLPKAYSMAQCTPDLTPAQCGRCLDGMVGRWWRTFEPNTQGSRSVGARCNMRVELYPFYTIPAMLQLQADAAARIPAAVPPRALAPSPSPAFAPPTVPDTTGGKRSSKRATILALVLPMFAAMAAATGFCYWRRRPAKTPPIQPLSSESGSESIHGNDSLILDLSTLRMATENFAEHNKLGEGGFGVVYKGSLPNGQDIAVKRLTQSSRQGIRELKNELVLVAKLQHKNLVRLLGVCLEENEKILIYEYMPNRSLDTILFDPDNRSLLDWGRRLKIINGIARGLQYLHEESQLKIVHRDVKASNILLDSDYRAKVADFGLARLFGGDQSQGVTSLVVGTYGYMAPEYAIRGNYSIKSDVFSFGVLVLEIVTGRRNNGSYDSEQSTDLLSNIWDHWTEGTIAKMVDRSLIDHAPGGQMANIVHVGLLCVQENPAERPAMSAVNVMLSSGSTASLQAPTRPAFYIQKMSAEAEAARPRPSSVETMPSMGRPVHMSANQVSITELEPR